MIIRESIALVLEEVSTLKKRATMPEKQEMVNRVQKRLEGVGGKHWYYSFIKRWKVTSISGNRQIETIRMQKSQPEITAEYFCMLHHLLALMQIQRALASGHKVEGWMLRKEGGVKRDGASEFGEDGWGE